jgi:hypothetical protein
MRIQQNTEIIPANTTPINTNPSNSILFDPLAGIDPDHNTLESTPPVLMSILNAFKMATEVENRKSR